MPRLSSCPYQCFNENQANIKLNGKYMYGYRGGPLSCITCRIFKGRFFLIVTFLMYNKC